MFFNLLITTHKNLKDYQTFQDSLYKKIKMLINNSEKLKFNHE